MYVCARLCVSVRAAVLCLVCVGVMRPCVSLRACLSLCELSRCFFCAPAQEECKLAASQSIGKDARRHRNQGPASLRNANGAPGAEKWRCQRTPNLPREPVIIIIIVVVIIIITYTDTGLAHLTL